MDYNTAWQLVTRHVDQSRDNPRLEEAVEWLTNFFSLVDMAKETNDEIADQLKKAIDLRKREEFFYE